MADWAGIDKSLDGLDHIWDTGDLGSIVIKNDVLARNHLGRFATHVQEAHARATEESLRRGHEVMVAAAPKRTGTMAGTIRYIMTGPKDGELTIGTDYWRYVAYGARPHEITGMVKFYWDREARWWTPGHNTINHPGTRAVPFIEAAYQATRDELMAAMRREYRKLN